MYTYSNSKPLTPTLASDRSKQYKALAIFLALAFVGIKYATSPDNATADVGAGGGKIRSSDKVSHIKTSKEDDWTDMSKEGPNSEDDDDGDKESYDENDDDDDFGNATVYLSLIHI